MSDRCSKNDIYTREGRERIRGFIAFVDSDSAILPMLNIIDSMEDEIATRAKQQDQLVADLAKANEQIGLAIADYNDEKTRLQELQGSLVGVARGIHYIGVCAPAVLDEIHRLQDLLRSSHDTRLALSLELRECRAGLLRSSLNDPIRKCEA